MTKRVNGGGTLVNLASGEEGIGRMMEAAGDASKRFVPVRNTEGPNFYLLKLPESVGEGVWKLSESELSWAFSENALRLRSYSDLFGEVASSLASRDMTSEKLPILGTGDIAFLATVDIGFLFRVFLPNESDPVGVILEKAKAGAIPAEIVSEMNAILSQSRLSAVIVANGAEVGSAYIVLDTAAGGSVDKLYGLASFILGGGTALEGWDSAYPIPLNAKTKALLARKGGRVMFGFGDIENYRQAVEISRDVEEAASFDNVIGYYVSVPRLSAMKEGELARPFIEGWEKGMEQPGIPGELFESASLDIIDTLRLRQNLDGHGEIDIIWKE
jgi:hypothetical protein